MCYWFRHIHGSMLCNSFVRISKLSCWVLVLTCLVMLLSLGYICTCYHFPILFPHVFLYVADWSKGASFERWVHAVCSREVLISVERIPFCFGNHCRCGWISWILWHLIASKDYLISFPCIWSLKLLPSVDILVQVGKVCIVDIFCSCYVWSAAFISHKSTPVRNRKDFWRFTAAYWDV